MTTAIQRLPRNEDEKRGSRPSFDPENLRPLLSARTLKSVGDELGTSRQAVKQQAVKHGMVAVSFWAPESVLDELRQTGNLLGVRKWRVDSLPENLQAAAADLSRGVSLAEVGTTHHKCPDLLSKKMRKEGWVFIQTHTASEKEAASFYKKMSPR